MIESLKQWQNRNKIEDTKKNTETSRACTESKNGYYLVSEDGEEMQGE